MTIHLSHPALAPARRPACSALLAAARALARWIAARSARWSPLGLRDRARRRLRHRRRAGCSTSPTRCGSRRSASTTSSASTGSTSCLLLTTACCSPAPRCGRRCARAGRAPGLYAFHIGLAESGVLGAFLAQDLALFVVFFDLMLVPFYFLTSVVGRPESAGRRSLKLVIYTLVGSLLMLAGAVATGVLAAQGRRAHHVRAQRPARRPRSARLAGVDLPRLRARVPDQDAGVPVPRLDARRLPQMPLAGARGLLRRALEGRRLRLPADRAAAVPDAAAHFQELMLLVALASILYGSAMAFTTTNARLILGYSSVAQLGFIVLGIFALDARGRQGALLQTVNHGLVVAPLFFIVALLAARAGGSEDMRDMGGIAFRAPVLAALFLVVALATLAMPGSSNFVGEFLILLGVFQAKLAIAIIASAGVVLAAVYALRLYIRAMHNRVGPHVELARADRCATALVLVPLVLVDPRARALPAVRAEARRAARSRGSLAAAKLVADAAAGRRATPPPAEEAHADDARCSPPLAPRPRTSTGRRCRRSSRCSAARSSCCWPACCAPRVVRQQARPGPHASSRSARRSGCAIWQWDERRRRSSRARCAIDKLTLLSR